MRLNWCGFCHLFGRRRMHLPDRMVGRIGAGVLVDAALECRSAASTAPAIRRTHAKTVATRIAVSGVTASPAAEMLPQPQRFLELLRRRDQHARPVRLERGPGPDSAPRRGGSRTTPSALSYRRRMPCCSIADGAAGPSCIGNIALSTASTPSILLALFGVSFFGRIDPSTRDRRPRYRSSTS
jgi:hypothetical protein